MEALPKPSDYQTMFRMLNRAACVVNVFFLDGPLGVGDPLIINRDGAWSLSLPKQSFTKLGRQGLELLRSQVEFEDYVSNFVRYMGATAADLIQRYSEVPDDMSAEEFVQVISGMGQLYKFYGFTESVFQDAAVDFLNHHRDTILQHNLETLNELKSQGRQTLNAYIMKDGVLDSLMDYIDGSFFAGADAAHYLYLDELKDLFGGVRPDNESIAQRRSSYVLRKHGGEIHYFTYDEAVKVSDNFVAFERGQIEAARAGLSGMVANRGVARGRVVIAPMLDLAEAQAVDKRMRKGDILIVQSTNPELTMLCKKAGAIVTNQGGVLSHAAIISRELNIPCIVGTVNGTRVFSEGDMVEVDANEGIVRRFITG